MTRDDIAVPVGLSAKALRPGWQRSVAHRFSGE